MGDGRHGYRRPAGGAVAHFRGALAVGRARPGAFLPALVEWARRVAPPALRGHPHDAGVLELDGSRRSRHRQRDRDFFRPYFEDGDYEPLAGPDYDSDYSLMTEGEVFTVEQACYQPGADEASPSERVAFVAKVPVECGTEPGIFLGEYDNV